jgi:hypothetical protein
VTGTTPTLTPLIEESDDNSTYTTVAAADLIGGAPPVFDSTYANSVVKRGYRGTKRYVRARYSAVSGTSPSFTMGMRRGPLARAARADTRGQLIALRRSRVATNGAGPSAPPHSFSQGVSS